MRRSRPSTLCLCAACSAGLATPVGELGSSARQRLSQPRACSQPVTSRLGGTATTGQRGPQRRCAGQPVHPGPDAGHQSVEARSSAAAWSHSLSQAPASRSPAAAAGPSSVSGPTAGLAGQPFWRATRGTDRAAALAGPLRRLAQAAQLRGGLSCSMDPWCWLGPSLRPPLQAHPQPRTCWGAASGSACTAAPSSSSHENVETADVARVPRRST